MGDKSNYYSTNFKRIADRNSFFLVDDSSLLSRLRCSLCCQIMIEPVQIDCGCRFCLGCVTGKINFKGSECPSCGEGFAEMAKLLKDKAIEKEIMRLDIKCVNFGCGEIVVFKELYDHLQQCDYREVQCVDCGMLYSLINRSRHANNDCSKRKVTCDDCGNIMLKEYYESTHRSYDSDNICDKWSAVCPYDCHNDTIINLKEHFNCCPNKPTQCPLAQLGCHEMIRRDDSEKHATENVLKHQEIILEALKVLKSENNHLRQQLMEKDEILNDQVRQLEMINSRNATEIDELTKKITNLDRRILELRGSREAAYDDVHVTLTIDNIQDKIQACRNGQEPDYLISDPVYLTRPGYNLAIKVYLAGDGRARNKYMSVYFVIAKGDYDHQLQWPFKEKVILTLHSHNPSIDDLICRMKPDDNYACYGRPLSSYNVAAGQPQFVKLTDIGKYVHNGSITLTLATE